GTSPQRISVFEAAVETTRTFLNTFCPGSFSRPRICARSAASSSIASTFFTRRQYVTLRGGGGDDGGNDLRRRRAARVDPRAELAAVARAPRRARCLRRGRSRHRPSIRLRSVRLPPPSARSRRRSL